MRREHVQPYRDDFQQVYRKPAKGFVCPITLRDEPSAKLCAGHIVPQSIQSAARGTVIQRADVDSHFGATIEPDLIDFLNVPIGSVDDAFLKARSGKLTLPTGEVAETFFSRADASQKVQQIALTKNGVEAHRVYLKNGQLDGPAEDMELECEIRIDRRAADASLVKAAYLALFKICGYAWVNRIAGDRVRRALSRFYDMRPRGRAKVLSALDDCFAELAGCAQLMLTPLPSNCGDTIRTECVLLHHSSMKSDSIVFAVSCLFEVNGARIMVTLPWNDDPADFHLTWVHYRRLLATPVAPKILSIAKWKNDRFHSCTRRFNSHYARTLPRTVSRPDGTISIEAR